MSIDWKKTAEYYNKSINELKVYFEKYPQSNKKVFVICDECKKEWKVYYQKYKDHGLCASCIKKGENSPIYKNSVGNEYLIGDPKNNKKIVVLEEIGQDKYGQKIVLVKCPYCENKFEVLEKSLKNGSTKFCNHCLEKTEIGKIKNGIKLLKFEYRDKNSKMYFKAKCHCGNIFIVNYNNWKKDYTKSCGCLHLTENTDIELIMQKELEKRNYNFKTQFKILTYSADILLIDYNIIIECDGRYWHDNPKSRERDKQRDIKIEKEGYKVFRFWDDEIKKHIDWCLKKIEDLILNYEYPNKYFMIDI